LVGRLTAEYPGYRISLARVNARPLARPGGWRAIPVDTAGRFALAASAAGPHEVVSIALGMKARRDTFSLEPTRGRSVVLPLSVAPLDGPCSGTYSVPYTRKPWWKVW
jgi:hypothetical protein